MSISFISQKLNLLNDTLIKEEQRVLNAYHKITKQAKQLMQQGEIDDIEFELKVCGFNSKNDEDFFFTSSTNCFLHAQLEYKNYTAEDYTELYPNHFKSISWNNAHCLSFHDLYDHVGLSTEKLLEISEIWLELKFSYQFFSKYNS